MQNVLGVRFHDLSSQVSPVLFKQCKLDSPRKPTAARPSAIHRDLSISTCTPYVHAIPRSFIAANGNEQRANHTALVSRHGLRLAPGQLAIPHRLQQRAKATRQEEGAADILDLVCDVKRVGCDGVFFVIRLADKPLTENPLSRPSQAQCQCRQRRGKSGPASYLV
jgi:hypothetical protein